jgi:hypothetical protein
MENCIIECTGLSKNWSELVTNNCHFCYLECSSLTAKFRQVERELQGYPKIPYPYHTNGTFDLSNLDYEDNVRFPLDLMNNYNTDWQSPTEIFINLLKRLGQIDLAKEPKSQKDLFNLYKYREYENGTFRSCR